MKKFINLMRLIAPLHCCYWMVLVTKRWLQFSVSLNQKNMITMEFEELKKIWDAQNGQPLYAINEKAMYNLILSKKKQAHHITNISELIIIIVYIITGSLVLGMNLCD